MSKTNSRNGPHYPEHVNDNPYIIVNEFTEYGVKVFKEDLDRLKNTNIPIVPIYIDSFGGEIYSLLAMIDLMENFDRPIATVALGKAMSCGSILLACGHKGLRFIGKNSTVMIHDAATVSWGKIEELKADVGEAERLNNIILELLADKCGQKNKDHFKKMVTKHKHANWFLSAKEAKQHKLIDHIGIPSLDTQFSFGVTVQPNEEVVLPKKQSSSRKSSK